MNVCPVNSSTVEAKLAYMLKWSHEKLWLCSKKNHLQAVNVTQKN
jgi:hypothetical protein